MAFRDTAPEKCHCPQCPRCNQKLCTTSQSKQCHHTPNAHLLPIKAKTPKKGPLPVASRELCSNPKIIAYGLSGDCDQVTAVPYENDERYGFFEDNPEIDLKKMRICSDLFHIVGASFNFEEDITITIELSKIERRKFEDFYIFAKQGGKWSSTKTKYDIKTGLLTFSIRRMDIFFAYSQQKKTEINLTQKGAKFVADDDKDIHINFPPDAVDGTKHLSVKVLDIDKGLQETMANFPNLFGITYMSPCVFVDHEMKDKLKVSAEVQVPFLPIDIPEDQKLVIFHWGEDKVTIRPGVASHGKGLCTLEADEFSGTSAALVSKNGISDVALDTTTKMFKGHIKLCKILSFRDPGDRDSLYIDCCQLYELKQRVSYLEEKGLREIPHSRSKDLLFGEVKRIKIQLKGSISYVAEVPRVYYCITYLSTCTDVHTNFPVRSVKRAGADPHAILVFETHGGKADILHVVHYDPDRLDNTKVAMMIKSSEVPPQKVKPSRPGTENKVELAEKSENQRRGIKKNRNSKIGQKSDKVEGSEDDEDENSKMSDAISTSSKN